MNNNGRRLGISIGAAIAMAALAAGEAQADVATFTHTGAEQSFTVPAGVTEVGIVAVGGKGGGPNGGFGAVASAAAPVQPGQKLYVEVGGNGAVAGTTLGPAAFNGGGEGGNTGGGGGGGASDVRTVRAGPPSPSASLFSRIVTAGGGGGGGGLSGGAGGNAGQPGQAGTQTAGTCDALAEGGSAGNTMDLNTPGGAGPSAMGILGQGGWPGIVANGGRGGATAVGPSTQAAGGGGGGGGGAWAGGGGGSGLNAVFPDTDFVIGSCTAGGGGGGASQFAATTSHRWLAIDTTGVPSVSIFYSRGGTSETAIDKAPKAKSAKRKVKFRFSATEPNSTFECSLDREQFEDCKSPQKYKKLKLGKHRFRVRATNSLGIVDSTPAEAKFKIVRRR